MQWRKGGALRSDIIVVVGRRAHLRIGGGRLQRDLLGRVLRGPTVGWRRRRLGGHDRRYDVGALQRGRALPGAHASAVFARRSVADVELLAEVAKEQVADDSTAQQQRHLQPLVVLDLDAVQVWLHDGHLLEPREEGDGNVGLLALLRLLARQVRRLARHVARHVLAQPALLPPRKVDSGGVGIGAGVCLGAVETRAAGHAEGDLGQAELPRDGAAPFGRLLPDYHLRVRVVQLDGELGGVYWLRRRRDAAIPANLLLRQRGLRPAGLRKHFAIEDVRAVRVEQCYGICVLRIVGVGVDVVEGILRIGVGAVLGEVVGFVVLELVGRRLEEEGYCMLAALSIGMVS